MHDGHAQSRHARLQCQQDVPSGLQDCRPSPPRTTIGPGLQARQPAQCQLQGGPNSRTVDGLAQNPLEDITSHGGLSLHGRVRHGTVAIVSQRDLRALAVDANHVAGQQQHVQLVLHGGAELCMLQLQRWRHEQGRKPCGRCLAGAAAEASEGLLAGHGGRINKFQKHVEAILCHAWTEGVLRPCNDGHVGRICGALARLPEPPIAG
jgi:hypothetical protein